MASSVDFFKFCISLLVFSTVLQYTTTADTTAITAEASNTYGLAFAAAFIAF